MKKLIILLIGIFSIFALTFCAYLYKLNHNSLEIETGITQKTDILTNSTWVKLSSNDFNGYLNGTYTEPVQTIINSLEEAIPVIFYINNNRFNSGAEGTFIVASAFGTSNQVSVYYYNPDKSSYQKATLSFESLLEDASYAFIYNRLEGTL